MKKAVKSARASAALAVILNIVLIACVVFSVLKAFSNAQQNSFAQNIVNVNTLTNASANKVELVRRCYMDEVGSIAYRNLLCELFLYCRKIAIKK